MSKQLEKKINKEDILDKLTNWDGKINSADKITKNLSTTVARLEVNSIFVITSRALLRTLHLPLRT